MSRFVNQKFALKLIVGGGVLIGLGVVASFIALFQAYDKVNKCFDMPGCSVNKQLLLVDSGRGMFVLGGILIGIAIAIYIALGRRSKP